MEHKISMALVNEDGFYIAINTADRKIESELETKIAESFTQINMNLNNELKGDNERRIAEKFRLCQHLNKFMEDYQDARS